MVKLRDLLKEGSDVGVVLDPLTHEVLERLGDEDLPVLALLTHHQIECRVLLSLGYAAAAWLSARALSNGETSPNDPRRMQEFRNPRAQVTFGFAQRASGLPLLPWHIVTVLRFNAEIKPFFECESAPLLLSGVNSRSPRAMGRDRQARCGIAAFG